MIWQLWLKIIMKLVDSFWISSISNKINLDGRFYNQIRKLNQVKIWWTQSDDEVDNFGQLLSLTLVISISVSMNEFDQFSLSLLFHKNITKPHHWLNILILMILKTTQKVERDKDMYYYLILFAMENDSMHGISWIVGCYICLSIVWKSSMMKEPKKPNKSLQISRLFSYQRRSKNENQYWRHHWCSTRRRCLFPIQLSDQCQFGFWSPALEIAHLIF